MVFKGMHGLRLVYTFSAPTPPTDPSDLLTTHYSDFIITGSLCNMYLTHKM